VYKRQDLKQAYYLIGQSGKNKMDYFIGTSAPATLKHYFNEFENIIKGKNLIKNKITTTSQSDIFSTKALHDDTDFTPSIQFQDIIKFLPTP